MAWVAAVASFGALLAAAGPTWAEGHGGGHAGGGGGHAAGGHAGFGGGHSFGGRSFGGGSFAGHAGGTRSFAAAPRFGGGSFHAAAAGRAYGAYAGGRVAGYNHVGVARAGFSGRAGVGVYGRGYGGAVWGRGWHPGYGWHWGGGYWGGRYWPPIFIGTAFAWYLPIVPAWAPVYWWGDVPYYYYNDVYYTWDGADNGYVASAPPPAVSTDEANANAPISDGAPYDAAAADAAAADAAGADAPTSGPTTPGPGTEAPSAPPPDSGNLYAYPKNGQSQQQQDADQQACQRWAATHASGGATGDGSIDYRRALAACLTGRGYSVD